MKGGKPLEPETKDLQYKVFLEGLDELKKFSDRIRNRTRYLPGCSVVPQPTTLPRAP
jgi:hypothetical protein